MLGHVTGFTRRLQIERGREISFPNWTFYSAICPQIGKLYCSETFTGLPYILWLSHRFAAVQVHAVLWSIRSMECCFERVHCRLD